MRLLNVTEAASFLKLHKTTLMEKARGQLLPAAKVGRTWVFIEDDLISYLREQYKCPSTSRPHRRSPSPG